MKSETLRDYEARMARVTRHIESNLDAAPSLEELARLAHFSPHHFHRVFRGVMGETIASHVRRLRLERAARKLRRGDARILEVALEAGYESHAAFTRAFKRVLGTSPAQWRGEAPVWERLEELEVEVVQRPAPWAMMMRHRGAYAEVGQTWGRALERATDAGRWSWGESAPIGLLWDDPEVTAPSRQRCDVGVMCEIPWEDEVLERRPLPEVSYARAMHHGAYEQLGRTYAYICGVWAARRGKEIADLPSIELYVRGPGGDRLETLVHVPLS